MSFYLCQKIKNMLVPIKRKCPKCNHEFISWTGGIILKDPLTLFTPCPKCRHWRTKIIKWEKTCRNLPSTMVFQLKDVIFVKNIGILPKVHSSEIAKRRTTNRLSWKNALYSYLKKWFSTFNKDIDVGQISSSLVC